MFLRRAQRTQRWQSPGVRRLLAATLGLSLLMLVLQLGVQYRDLAAARFPALLAGLQGLCLPLGCSVGPARLIESLSVESSGLLRVEKSNLYKLQISLCNRAGIPLALPALDLTLTDARGGLIARKVLSAGDLGSTISTLEPGRELVLSALLQTGPGLEGIEPVSGYSVEIFYP